MSNLRLDDPLSERLAAILAPLGWALHSRWPDEARTVVSSGQSDLDADVTAMWNFDNSARLKHIGIPLGRYGRLRSTDYQRRAQLRSLLVSEAVACHIDGRFAAATALALTQIDGLTTEVMGSTFFRHHPDPASPVYIDNVTLAGIEGNLPVVRSAFSEPYDTTGRHGSISRHGILHGRDLTFATRATSTKTLVLLAALIERLEAPAEDRARRERRQLDERLMKLTGVDDEGRLQDARCLDEVYMFRADLDTDMHEQLRFGALTEDSLIKAATRRLRERRLHRGSFRVLDVGKSRYAWVFRLPSGHFLGSSHNMTKTTIPVSSEQLTWDAATAPDLPPWVECRGWADTSNGDPQTANWAFTPHFT